MKVLDVDMDYFMFDIGHYVSENPSERFEEEKIGESVWNECEVREFFEKKLGLSKDKKIPGRIVVHHNETLYFWKEMIENELLQYPFEVVHIDSHADLGLGCTCGDQFIMKNLLGLDVEQRWDFKLYNQFVNSRMPGIGDYLLFAIAFRWISKLTYCANPNGECNDFLWYTMKDFYEPIYVGDCFRNTIQLLYNSTDILPKYSVSQKGYKEFLDNSVKEPEVPFEIIHSIEKVNYSGDFDFISIAQSPNYTPKSADYILDVFKDYVEIV